MKFCKRPGCPNLVESGYCPEHKPPDRARSEKVADAFYVSKQWRRLRDWYISGNPLCEICGGIGSTIHHKTEIKAGGDRLSVDNLLTVCGKCHYKVHPRQGKRSELKKYSY